MIYRLKQGVSHSLALELTVSSVRDAQPLPAAAERQRWASSTGHVRF
jgi:hypothetical protein